MKGGARRRIALVASAATAAAVTTAATTVATTAAATAEAAATTTAALFAGTSFVYRQGPAADLLAVQRLDGVLSFLVGAHFDEAEAFGSARVAVHDHLSGLHRPVPCEHLLERAVGYIVAEVSDVQLLTHV